MIAAPSHANGLRIQYYRIQIRGLGSLQLVNLDCKHQNGGSVPWMTKRNEHAWEEIKDSLSLWIINDFLFLLRLSSRYVSWCQPCYSNPWNLWMYMLLWLSSTVRKSDWMTIQRKKLKKLNSTLRYHMNRLEILWVYRYSIQCPNFQESIQGLEM